MPAMNKTGALAHSGEGSTSEKSTSAELRPEQTRDETTTPLLAEGLLQRIAQLPDESLNLGAITEQVSVAAPKPGSFPSRKSGATSRRQRGSQRRTSSRAPKHLPKKRGGRRHG
jgi:hypothetical protein